MPDTHHHVVDVVVDGVSQGAIGSYTFSNVTADHTISATFAVDTNTITASAGANGSVTPAGVTAVPWNGTQAYTITPAANHHVSDVLVDGVSVGAVTSYTFNNVTAAPHHLGHLRRRHQHHHRERRRQRLRHPGRRDGRALERDAGLHDHPGGQPPRRQTCSSTACRSAR